MRILAIDPGYERSAGVLYDAESETRPITAAFIESNENVRAWLREYSDAYDVCACEMLVCFGMPVGKEVLETCREVGRFQQIVTDCNHLRPHPLRFVPVTRTQEKQYLCRSQRANDATIRQALLDRFGPGRDKAIGRKKSPGPLYGLKADMWSALAVAVTYAGTCDK